MSALSGLPHTQQLDALAAYNSLRAPLFDFLRQFAASGREIDAGDIRRFFSELESRRRQSSSNR
jgi:hypothetical protein